MNPILFKNKVDRFCAELDVVYFWEFDAFREFETWRKEHFNLKERSLDTDILDSSTRGFLKNNSLTLDEKKLFYDMVQKYIQRYLNMVLQLKPVIDVKFGDSIYSLLMSFKKRINDCVSYIEYEIEQIKAEHEIDIKLEKVNSQLEENGAKLLKSLEDEYMFASVSGEMNTEIKGLSWKNKTELSELIFVLFHSKRVLKNGLPIQKRELTQIFNKLFNTDIKEPSDLLGKTTRTYKRGDDGQTFIKELNSYLEEYHGKKRAKQ
jgi:hypothetical protein